MQRRAGKEKQDAGKDQLKRKHKVNQEEDLKDGYHQLVNQISLPDQLNFRSTIANALLKIKARSIDPFDFFVDCYTMLMCSNQHISEKVQWLSDWTPYLLFIETPSEFIRRYADLTSPEFEKFFNFAKKQFEDEELSLHLRLRFGLLITFAYAIPLYQGLGYNDFEISLRPIRKPYCLTPDYLKPAYNRHHFAHYLDWLERITHFKHNNRSLDVNNLIADCKQLAGQLSPPFYLKLAKMGQAFFVAAERFQSDLSGTGPDLDQDPKPGRTLN